MRFWARRHSTRVEILHFSVPISRCSRTKEQQDISVRVEAESIMMAERQFPRRLPEGVLEAFVTRRRRAFRLPQRSRCQNLGFMNGTV